MHSLALNPIPRVRALLQGAAYCVFSQVGRDFMPDPVHEAQVRQGAPANWHVSVPRDFSKRAQLPEHYTRLAESLLTSCQPRTIDISACPPLVAAALPPLVPTQFRRQQGSEKPFKPVGSCHKRLSMRDVNPYTTAARPAPDIDFTLFSRG